MKPTAPKIHLLESESKLSEGIDHVAMCSEENKPPVIVPKANFVMAYEAGKVTKAETPLNTISFCRKCTSKLNFRPTIAEQTRVYLYYAIAGQETRTAGMAVPAKDCETIA